jgi:hypothetical protein
MDFNVKLNWASESGTPSRWRLVPFGKYIIAMYSFLTNNSSYGESIYDVSTSPGDWDSDSLSDAHYTCEAHSNFNPSDSFSDLDTFFINTETGSVHGFAYGQLTHLADMFFVPVEDVVNDQYLYILNKAVAGASDTTCAISRMRLTSDDEELEPFDTTQTVPAVNPPVYSDAMILFLIEFHRFVPDGTTQFQKKFRNFVIEGLLPQWLEIRFSFSASDDFTTAKVITTAPDIDDRKYPVAYRFPVNQRGRAISVRIQSSYEFITPVESPLSIASMSVFWSYTGRGPVTSDNYSNSDPQYT